MDINLNVITKVNDDGTYDAEVMLCVYGDDGEIVYSTKNRLISRRWGDRPVARAAAVSWVRQVLVPIIEKLPLAKP